MPNSNYLAGVRFERKVKKQWERLGFTVLRTAGSHGPVDLVAIMPDDVSFIQCKRTQTMAQANRLWKNLKACPPLEISEYYDQWLEVYVAERRTQYQWRLDDI